MGFEAEAVRSKKPGTSKAATKPDQHRDDTDKCFIRIQV